ncbi:motility associated factor glycosyltransferase family protein [Virgibacillus flavescens]|uniref:motility associated factor glycosyltransferase family protein n=1 Tax=Virgibacillus flavescens TaxID=1611422 RepID=UPI003D325C91
MLIENILFLRKRFPQIRKYYSENEKEIKLDKLNILDSKSGQKTLSYQTEENKEIMVHSKYDPIREANRIITSYKDKIDEYTHVFFYGIGMGYHIEEFNKLFPNNSYSLYEPIPEIFLALAQNRKLNPIVTNQTSQLYIDGYINDSINYLNEFKKRNENIQIIILPGYENIIKNKINEFSESVRKTVQGRRSNVHTNIHFQKLWVKNSIINFKEVLNTPNIIKDIDHMQFNNKPALIVSAGPSLAEDMESIRFIKENKLANIFAVGSAINSMIEYDVLPDAVCTYDPGGLNHEVYKKMMDSKINHIPMIFGSSVGHETITKYNGPKAHFITTQDRTSSFLLNKQLNVEHDYIMDSPSIAVMTFQVLNKLGADPIIFAGQNLGYLYDQLYAKGIEYENIRSTVDKKQLENAIKTKDVYGNDIKTSISFNSMRENIEYFAKLYKDKTLINTTKGGAKINGVPFRAIEDVVKDVLTVPIEKEIWWNNNNSYKINDFTLQLRNLEQSIIKYEELINKFEELLEVISTNSKMKNKIQIENSFSLFDELYTSLNQNSYYSKFLSFYIRVHVEWIGNEIKRITEVRDPIARGAELAELFSRFIVQCKYGHKELKELLQTHLFMEN